VDEVMPVIQKEPFIRKRTLVAMGAAAGVGVICFVVVALLPAPQGPLFKDPLRSFLTGFGVVGVAYPLCVVGLAMRKRWASSPYFEGAFIAGVINLFGFVIVGVGLVCIGFGAYGLIVRLLGL